MMGGRCEYNLGVQRWIQAILQTIGPSTVEIKYGTSCKSIEKATAGFF